MDTLINVQRAEFVLLWASFARPNISLDYASARAIVRKLRSNNDAHVEKIAEFFDVDEYCIRCLAHIVNATVHRRTVAAMFSLVRTICETHVWPKSDPLIRAFDVVDRVMNASLYELFVNNDPSNPENVVGDPPSDLPEVVGNALVNILLAPRKKRGDFRRHLKILCLFLKTGSLRAAGGGEHKGPARDLRDLEKRLCCGPLAESYMSKRGQRQVRPSAVAKIIVGWLNQHPELLDEASSSRG